VPTCQSSRGIYGHCHRGIEKLKLWTDESANSSSSSTIRCLFAGIDTTPEIERWTFPLQALRAVKWHNWRLQLFTFYSMVIKHSRYPPSSSLPVNASLNLELFYFAPFNRERSLKFGSDTTRETEVYWWRRASVIPPVGSLECCVTFMI
jgi:hypothetical protein